MSVEIHGDMVGLDEASKALDALLAADAAPDQAGAGQPSPDPSVPDAAGEHAAPTDRTESTSDPASEPAADAQAPAPTDPSKPADPETPGDKSKSRYEKARERQERSWQELNAQKEALKTERAALEAERRTIDTQRQEFESRRQQAEAEFTPDQYEDAAKRFDDEGKFDLAELARKKADTLRRHPPAAQRQQAEAAQAAVHREWALKAGVDFPDLARANSPLQTRVAQLFQEEPDLKTHPKGIYLAARLADLEARAARADGAENELGQLRARVKELEGLTAPGGEGGAQRLPGAKSFEQMSADEQFTELTRQAQDIGVLTR